MAEDIPFHHPGVVCPALGQRRVQESGQRPSRWLRRVALTTPPSSGSRGRSPARAEAFVTRRCLDCRHRPAELVEGRGRAIPHVEIVRIGTRVPNALPQRVTPELCARLRKHHPVFVMVHFSHPRELTPEAARACNLLADHGFPLLNQTVLLRGVNDDAEILRDLFRGLLRLRVKPYYLYQADLAQGATHFRTSVEKGLEIMDKLRGRTSGLAVPYFVIDAPGGGGKIPLLPPYLLSTSEHEVVVRNFEGRVFHYPLPPAESSPACDPAATGPSLSSRAPL